MRLCEFSMMSRRYPEGFEICAWAKYRRGDVPEPGEFDYINKRVLSKCPTAELISMDRRLVPTFAVNGKKPPATEVEWEFKWAVLNNTISGNDAGETKTKENNK